MPAHESISWPHSARRMREQLDTLAQITDEPGLICRTFLSPAMRRVNEIVARWMQEAGWVTREDGAGNVIGEESDKKDKPTLLLGSHLDTVRDAGRFDGPLGVILAIEAVRLLRQQGVSLPFAVEVIGFSDEEGVRFQSAYLGSKALCGLFTEADFALQDKEGIRLSEALTAWQNGSSPDQRSVTPADFSPRSPAPLGYVEVHIEQGPVLEKAGLSLGVVQGIAGQERLSLEWMGRAAHAGTTPPVLRRDALAAAAEFIGETEKAMEEMPDLRATVGWLEVSPNVGNVVPARVAHTLDVRHLLDAERERAVTELEKRAKKIAARRQVELGWKPVQVNGAVPCDSQLSAALAKSVKKVVGQAYTLPSGAGHDGVIVSRLCPVAMLFVRCRGGISHHPDEDVSEADLAQALAVVCDFLRTFQPV